MRVAGLDLEEDVIGGYGSRGEVGIGSWMESGGAAAG